MRSALQSIYKWLFLAYLAILPVANTIALRNIFLFLLLVILVVWVIREGEGHLSLPAIRDLLPIPLLLWAGYLLLFPFWAPDSDQAWTNLRGQWGLSLTAWVVGMGAVLVLGRRGPGLWGLAMASAFLVGLHLFMTAMAWGGLFGSGVPSDLPVPRMWTTAVSVLSGGRVWSLQPFPWGFRGFDPMHGNLGYTACQAIALFGVLMYFGRLRRTYTEAVFASVMIGLCFVSMVVASSRGGVLFAVLILMIIGAISLVHRRRPDAEPSVTDQRKVLHLWVAALAVLVVVSAATFHMVKSDVRWQTMADKVRVGLMLEDPLEFLCNGLSADAERMIRQSFSDRPSNYADAMIDGLVNQDGGRIVLMRVGIDMVREYPWGQDGARGTYKKLIERKCGHEPKVTFAHLHQSWMDLSLALGLPGGMLFALVLLNFARIGWRGLQDSTTAQWSLALIVLALFWGARGFADSLYREHYLQMQAVLLAYCFGRTLTAPKDVATDADPF